MPGLLLAATGVGAGDLLTSTLAGSEAGLVVLWAAAVGGLLKWVLSEGVARWQLATGTTVLEGWHWKLGGWTRWVFFAYLVLFSLIVGRALSAACGMAGDALLPLNADGETSRLIWSVIHSLVGLAMVLAGGFRLFQNVMAALVGVMFVTVISTALMIGPDWSAVARGFIPAMPATGSSWVLAVLGGVGGTVVLLSYGYWIEEQGRRGLAMLSVCRADLAAGLAVTALFGLAVIIIGSRLNLSEGGALLAVKMAEQLETAIGPAGRWIFLAGFWAAVFSSLLGVWQSIPYMVADIFDLGGARPGLRRDRDLRRKTAYKLHAVAIAVVPLFFLKQPIRDIQLLYGVFAAFFLPLLALTLLIMNNRRRWVGSDFLTPAPFNLVLVGALILFAYLGASEAGLF